MSVYPHKNSPHWHYDFVIEGHRFHGSTEAATKTLAKAVEAAERQKALQQAGKAQMTLNVACGLFWHQYGQHDRAAATTEYQLGNLIRLIGKDMLIAEIDDNQVAGFISRRRGETSKRGDLVAPSSVNRERELLRRVMNKARKIWKAAILEIDWKDHALKEPPPVDNPLKADDEIRLLTEAVYYLRDPIRFSLFTGVRLANVKDLDWTQCDMHSRQIIWVLKGGRRLILPMTDEVFLLLVRQGPKQKGPVFTRDGKQIKSWRSAWEGAKRRAGMDEFRWHDLRHTAGSRMVARGVDISVVQEVMGHADITTTRRYVHHKQAAKKAALEALSSSESRNNPEPSSQVGAAEGTNN